MARSKRSKARKTFRREDFPLRFSPLSLAVATAVGSMAGHVMAQEAEDAEAAEDEQFIEEVVVTGFRQSLQNAMELKRDSDLIVEAISAEDLGKLPDNSIAEALTRLTGLAGQRLNGRQQVISIRGLAPDFSTALLNGRQQVSAGDNRGVEFDQYPSELLSEVVVYKTPSASLTGQGLAGTVDMRTISPLEYGRRAVAANIRNEWTEVSSLNPETDDSGLRYSLSYIDQFADGNVGLAVGYAHIGSPSQRELMDVWGWEGGFAPTGGARIPSGGISRAQSGEVQRSGLMAVLEFDGGESMHSTIDLYRSSFEESTLTRQFEMPLNPNWGLSTLLDHQASGGVVTNATFDNVKGVLGNNLDSRDASMLAAGWNLEWDVNDQWAATMDISHSAIEREEIILSLNSGTGPAGQGDLDTITYSYDGGIPQFSGVLDYTSTDNIVLTSPMGWGGWADGRPIIPGGQTGYDNRPSIDDELTQIRLSAERFLDGAISSIDFGIQFDSRTKSKVNSNQGFLGFTDGSLALPFRSSGVVSTPYGLPPVVTFDPLAAFDSGIYYRVDNYHSGVVSNDWTVDEDVTLAWAEFGIDTEWGNVPLTGNFGLQLVQTDQGSAGSSARDGQYISAASAGLATVTGGDSYTEVLPSINLNFEVADAQFVRFGLARTLARARMDDLRAGRSVSFNVALADSTNLAMSPWGGGGGNPELRPWVADSIDLSWEKYFQDGLGYVALAVFHKDLKTYVYDQSVLVDFSDFDTGGITPALTNGFVTRPANGEGGTLQGFEFSIQANGDIIAPSLAGFGAVLNASFTDSEIERGTGDPSTPLPGLSDTVINLTLFYEQGGFSARISRNHRSDFLGEVAGFGAARTRRDITEENLVDAQLSYAFNEGTLAGVTLFLQGTNLTDEPFISYLNGDPRQVKDYQLYGATYFFGGSYRF